MSAADYGLAGGAGGEGATTTSYADAAPSTSAAAMTTISTPPLASAPLRDDMIANAVSFLVHPKVRIMVE